MFEKRTKSLYSRAKREINREQKPKKREAIQSVISYLEAIATQKMSTASRLFQEKEYYQSYKIYEAIWKNYRGFSLGKTAKRKLKEFKTSSIQNEMFAEKKLKEILLRYNSSKKGKKLLPNILKNFANYRKFVDTKAGQRAALLYKILGG